MGVSNSHLIRKIERIQNRTRERRAERSRDILSNRMTPNGNPLKEPQFDHQTIEAFKQNYRSRQEKYLRTKNLWIAGILLIAVPLACWFIAQLVLYAFHSKINI